MNIVVCIKQVPDVDDIKWTKENNLDRSAMLSKINAYDEMALDWALKVKSQFKDARVTVLSMGPSSAGAELNYAIAKGADRAILLCDKMFAASDTLATSKILCSAIRKFCYGYNLIMMGNVAADGDTAQVPVSVSQLLNIIDVTNCVEIINADKNLAIVKQELDGIISMLEVKTPCLITIKKECDKKYQPKIEDYVRAQNTGYEIYCFDDLGVSKNEVGIIGSPTYVNKAFRPEFTKEPQIVGDNYKNIILEEITKASIQG